jgi:DNA-binding response OmpR family regulator
MLQERFADRGLSGFLQKPYTARELVAKIRSVLVR